MSTDKTVEDTYVQKTQLEHIIDLPDTYIGSIEKTQIETWVYNEEENRIEFRNIEYIPGLYKIFDEIAVNAMDQHIRIENNPDIIHKLRTIKVSFEGNKIIVYNDGEGIPILIHKKHNIYVPELIFGNLLTSSNYDKKEEKITGGKNGYGAKLTNIFSKHFRIETVDSNTKLKYTQNFYDNMTRKDPPVITPYTQKPYTIIEFSPDLNRFDLQELDSDTILLMKKRVIDMTACTNKNVSVFLDDKKLDCKSLEKYIHYYLDPNVERVYEEVNDRWEVVIAVNPDTKFEQISFVNGICTMKGGKHVDHVVNHITKKIQTYMSTKGLKRKKVDIKPAHIKDNLFVFIRSIIVNPSFDSQIKEYLTTPSTSFGSKFEMSEKGIEKLIKTSLIERAMKLNDFKENLGLQKSSGRKTNTIRGVDKLDDANKAGTLESKNCTLILTEGDSAKALAISGLSVVGRDYFGVFPLRGKVLNVRDISMKRVSDNNEISSLVKILGLKYNAKTNINELRYGRIMIFTDADVDGSHIKGLIMNLFATFWPNLLEIPGFIISLATPIIKVKRNKEVHEFFTMSEFKNWEHSIVNIRLWEIKYYKGLGTSTSEEAKSYFTNFNEKNISYLIGEDTEDEKNRTLSIDKIDLAFDKKRSDDRKVWLKTYDKERIIEQSQKNVFYHEFIDNELIHFSKYDNERSIPSLCDGLKPSLRKILFSCFKRNLKKEIKVAQLAGYISENSAYHHGEQSLYDSIIGMAQNYVGSNNIELLEPRGQFGTRLAGGKDSASPRYIFTLLSEMAFQIFNSNDNELLEYNEDDGKKIEPVWYIPILPFILINGTDGIGTGFSTKIPAHDPEIVVRNLIHLMNEEPLEKMIPYYRGFKGVIEFKGTNDIGIEQYINRGRVIFPDDTTMIIEELPIGKWTDDYKAFLETLLYDRPCDSSTAKTITRPWIIDFKNNSTEKVVHFTIKFKKEDLHELRLKNDIENVFKLTDTKYTNYTNMHLYNSGGIITKYENVEQILHEFYMIRLAFYVKRKEYLLRVLQHELDIYQAKIRFIEEFIDGTIDIMRKEDEEVQSILEERNYPKFGSNENTTVEEFSYDYLLNMKIKSLTKKKIEELKGLFENKQSIYNDLSVKTEKELWKDDLDTFLVSYRKNLKEYNEILDEQRSKLIHPTQSKKKVVVKKK